MAVFEALTLASFGLNALSEVRKFRQDQIADKASLETASAQAKLNNELDRRTQQAINEEQMLLMRAYGFDKFEIAKSVRAAKASLKASQGGAGALSDLQNMFTNIDRMGANAVYSRNLNLGNSLRNLDIERTNARIRTRGLNNQAFSFDKRSNPSAFGLKLLGLGIDTFQKVGFKTDPTTGKRVLRGSGTGQQVPINPNKPKIAPPLPDSN